MRVTFDNKTFDILERRVSNLVAGNGAKTAGTCFILRGEEGRTEISATLTKAGIRKAGGVKRIVRSMLEDHYRCLTGARSHGCGPDLVFSLNRNGRTREKDFECDFNKAYIAREKLISYGLVTSEDVERYGDELEKGNLDACEQLILSKSDVLSRGSKTRRSFMRTIEANYVNFGDGSSYEGYDWELSVFFTYCSHVMKLYSKVFGA